MDAKHTQWRIEPEASRDGRRGYWIQDGEDYVAMACIRNDEAEEIKNARLIAAAPMLLEALQNIVASLSEHDDEGMIEHAEQMIAARAAIATATQPEPTP